MAYMTGIVRTRLLSVALASVGIAFAGCGDDATDPTASASETGTASGTQTTETGNTTAPTSDPTTAGPTVTEGTMTGNSSSGSTSSTSDPTTSSTSTSSPGTETTDPSTSTTEDPTDTGPGLCEFIPDGEIIEVSLYDTDMPAGGCGKVMFEGRIEGGGNGVWNMDKCPCGAQCFVPDPWTLEIDPPQGWMPNPPMCLRVVLETVQGFAPDTCYLKGLAIWDIDELDLAPVYLAGGTPPQLPEINVITVGNQVIDVCPNDGGCSDDELHALDFLVGDDGLYLEEGEQGQLAASGRTYDVINFQSHVNGLCDAPPSFYWAMDAT